MFGGLVRDGSARLAFQRAGVKPIHPGCQFGHAVPVLADRIGICRSNISSSSATAMPSPSRSADCAG
jgi:hypothetical protein